MTVVKASIDLGAGPADRVQQLMRILANVLEDTDAGPDRVDRRRWIAWTLLYILWHEGRGATTRRQDGGGPGRGLMQFEPRTVRDLIANYILGPTPGLVANLAAAAGVSEEEMRAALRAFSGSDAPRDRNTWPLPNPGDPSTKIEEWLLGVDSFGIKLMRLYFRAQGEAHRFPPARDDDLTLSAQHEDYKDEHARHWGRWWKRSFKDEDDEAAKLKTFRERAEQVDRVAERVEESPPGGPGAGPRGQCLRPFVAIVVVASLVALEAFWR